MAVTCLSPWPTTPAALTAATAILRQVLPAGLDDTRIQRLGAAAAGQVEKYAPVAPQAAKDTAVERCAGWLAGQPAPAVRSETVGDIVTDYAINNVSALRHSGAMALLTMYKRRRAGAI